MLDNLEVSWPREVLFIQCWKTKAERNYLPEYHLCLSYCSAVKRDHGQDNLWKKAPSWGLSLQCQGLFHNHGREHGGSQASMTLEQKLRVGL